MTSTPIISILNEIKNFYKPLIFIFLCTATLQLGLTFQTKFFESNLIPHFLIILFPLAVSVYSFVISRLYGGSKVFGRSYFAFGLGYFLIFLTELLYVYYYDISGQDVPEIADYFLMTSYFLLLTHLIINIRYFSENLSTTQKAVIILTPAIIVPVYSLLVLGNVLDSDYAEAEIPYGLLGNVSYYYYSVILVFLSSLTMGFAIVGFSLFRQTVLFTSWLLILVGISVSTIGDLVYHYVEILGGNWFESVTTLWIASNMIMLYALYRHQRAI